PDGRVRPLAGDHPPRPEAVERHARGVRRDPAGGLGTGPGNADRGTQGAGRRSEPHGAVSDPAVLDYPAVRQDPHGDRRAGRVASATQLADEVERWLADQPVAAQRSVVTALARRADEHPDDPVIREQLARHRANLGLILSGMGRDADALRELADAADVFARLF